MCGCSSFIGEEKESNVFQNAGIGMLAFMLIAAIAIIWYVSKQK
jgi:hypothetical protein